MNTYKILFGKQFEILSITESDNQMPEDASHYYDKSKAMKIPDFLLVKASDADNARKMGEAFAEKWKHADEYDQYSNE